MNYFQLYNIPLNLTVDRTIVKKKFYELSRQYHPDFYSNATDEEKEEALEKSSLVNKAFKIFTNADATIQYVLKLKGLLTEEEKYALPNEFLMEMMELNEQLMEAKMENNKATISNFEFRISNLQTEIYEPVKTIIEHYQEAVTTEKELLQVKDYYYKKKYLTRILDGLL